MPLLDIQKRAAQIGRLRIGTQVKTGKTRRDGSAVTRPKRLETWRLTTSSRHAADAVAELLGGGVQPFEYARTAGQWEVTTEIDTLPVMVPPVGAITQDYELWTAAGCERRCDSQTEQLSGGPCLCPHDPKIRASKAQDGQACRPTTRLNVMLPDLPGLGLWRLDSHGYYAAVELGGVAPVLAEATARAISVAAELAIEQREVRRPGQDVKRFPVPVLRVLPSMRDLAAIGSGGQRPTLAGQLPPPVRPVAAAIGAGSSQGGPVSTAQQFMNRALATRDPDVVRDVWREANTANVLDQLVQEPGNDAVEPLTEALQGITADLERARAAR